MARPRRIGPKDITQHVIQRGNNRKVCFSNERDYRAYVVWLKQYSGKYDVAIHAWVLMTNHVHLLCTPLSDNRGVSQMMQSLGRQYVRYFNDTYRRTGTLWEGRFKSCLVCSSTYLLRLYRYIELNPVRAKIVSDPSTYKWSSYQINALGKTSELCQPHSLYDDLGANKSQRLTAYKALFEKNIEQSMINNIRGCTNKELVLGPAQFKEEIQLLTNDKLKTGKLGRPFKIN
jgi:putative transposase